MTMAPPTCDICGETPRAVREEELRTGKKMALLRGPLGPLVVCDLCRRITGRVMKDYVDQAKGDAAAQDEPPAERAGIVELPKRPN